MSQARTRACKETSSRKGSVYAATYLLRVKVPNAVSPCEKLPRSSIRTGHSVRKPTMTISDQVSFVRASVIFPLIPQPADNERDSGDRKSVVMGTGGQVREAHGVCRILTQKR